MYEDDSAGGDESSVTMESEEGQALCTTEEEVRVSRNGPITKSILKRTSSSSPTLGTDKGSAGKSVSFRDVLADFVEPTPIASVKEEDYANVLEAYRKLCAKLRVRPCQKLTDQLEGLKDSTLKLDTIDLKGTRLDPAHCEALEAVLRVLRAQTLNIEQTQLDDDGATSLFEMVEYYEPISRLIVANNVRLGVRAWLALARLLKRVHCKLEYLDVRRTSLDESTMPLLCRVLKLNCNLRVLHLEDNHLGGILTRNLVWGLRTNTTLQDLYLGHNKLTAEDAKLLGSLLITNRTIRLLDLRNNRLQDTGMLFLASALEEQQTGLQLITVWCNQITSSSMTALGRALAFHSTLEGVNLGSNALGNKGVEFLKEGLLSSRSIARLVMASCNITNEGGVVLAEIVGDHTTLIHLDLRENNITLAGVMALKCAYSINHRLLRLHLDVMKRSNNDELMAELLGEIEGYSVRNLDQHKNQVLSHQEAAAQEGSSSEPLVNGEQGNQEQTETENPARSAQVAADYMLAMKLQSNENRNPANRKREEKRQPLPIISPTPSSPPDPTKTFGFFSGHAIKLKARWEESNFSMYFNRGDPTLAAPPGSVEYYPSNERNSPGSTDDEETFVDAVEEQHVTNPAGALTEPGDSNPPAPHSSPPPPPLLLHLAESSETRDGLGTNLASHEPRLLGDLGLGDLASPDTPSPGSISNASDRSRAAFDEVWFGNGSPFSPSSTGSPYSPSSTGSPFSPASTGSPFSPASTGTNTSGSSFTSSNIRDPMSPTITPSTTPSDVTTDSDATYSEDEEETSQEAESSSGDKQDSFGDGVSADNSNKENPSQIRDDLTSEVAVATNDP